MAVLPVCGIGFVIILISIVDYTHANAFDVAALVLVWMNVSRRDITLTF